MNSLCGLAILAALSCFAGKTGSLPSPVRNERLELQNSLVQEELYEVGIPEFPEIRDYSCLDLYDRPYIADIPHPYRCDVFIKCSPYLGENGVVIPVGEQVNCATGHGGASLLFSMETCDCDYPEVAVCFNENNSTHVEQKFKCACPLLPDGRGGYVQDDKCSIGKHR